MNDQPEKKAKLSDPLSIMAHQLKHPLSVVRSYADALISGTQGEVNDKQREYLRDIMTNAERMTEVVSDMIDISKIEEGRYDLRLSPVNLVEITERTVRTYTAWAQAWGGSISFEHEAIPLVMTEPDKIRQVVENFIGNAVRYGLPGKGMIEVKVRREGDEVIFSCKDSGIGVHMEDMGKLFTKYYRSEEAVNIYPQGSGLGLYINKIIVEKSGGKIWFENNKEAGSTFYFTLPVAKEG